MVFAGVNFQFLKQYQNQILATLAVNIITFSHGNAVGWLAPTLLILQSENSPLKSGPITIEEASWIGSLVCVGGLIGSFTFGVLVNQIGRKKSFYLLTVPHLSFWLMLIFGRIVPHLYIARILSGITGGSIFVAIPTFVADIADNRIRGTLGSMLLIFFNGGILSGFVLAAYLSYSLFPCVTIGFSLVYIIAIYCLPDTPQYFIQKRKDGEAENALRFYRNFKAATKEECQEFNEQFTNLKNRMHGSVIDNESTRLSLKDFLKPAAVQGLLIGLGLMFLNQFSGLFALINYTANIFQLSGSSMNPSTSTIIVGAIQLLGTFVAAGFVDRIGRKILLVVSCLGVSIGSFALSIYSFLSLSDDLSDYSWIAVSSLSFAILLGSFGLTPLPFVVLTEVMPQKVKSTAITICTCGLTVMAFTVLKIYPIMMVNLGIYGVMWVFSGITLAGAVVIYIFLPETKGRKLDVSEEFS